MKRVLVALVVLVFMLGPTALSAGAVAQASLRADAPFGIRAARAAVARYERQPKFIGPGSRIPIARARGKSVWVIAVSMSIPFTASVAQGVQLAAARVGISTHVFDGKGTQSEWIRGINEAVSQHANGVVLIGVPLPLVSSALETMHNDHVPFIDVPTDCKQPLPFGEFGHVCISFTHAGALQADYAIAHAGAKPTHVLLLEDNEYPSEENRLHGMEAEFRKLAPHDTVDVHNTLTSQNATQLGPSTVNLIRRDPRISWVLATYDAQLLYVVPALQQAGLASKVRIVGSDAVSSNLNWTKTNHVQVADVGEPDHWMGWASLDLIARAMLGRKAVNEHIQLRLFSSGNLKGIRNTGNEDRLFGGNYRARYARLWGLR